MAISSQLQMVTALSAILLPPVFQKTTNAVTENNYSFRQSLLLEKQFISPPPTIAACLPRGLQPASSSAQGCIADLFSPFPWLRLPGHVPSVTRHQNSILMTLMRRSRPSLASLLCDCAVSAGDTGPRLHSVLSQPLAGPRTMRNNLIPQVFLFC